MAEAKGIRGAARATGRSRSQLGRSLSALEERLRAQLVDRDGGRFVLTEVGRTFLVRARAILEQAEEAAEEVRASSSRVRGPLRVVCSEVLGEVAIEAVVSEFLGRYPETSVDVHLSRDRIDLHAHRADLAFRTAPLEGKAGVRQRRLADSPTILVAHPGYLEARGTPATIADLQQHDCVFVGSASGWRLRDAHAAITPRLRFNGFEPARRAVCARLGIGRFAAAYVAKELAQGALRVVLPDQTVTATLYAVILGSGRVTPVQRAFLDLAVKRITSEALRALRS